MLKILVYSNCQGAAVEKFLAPHLSKKTEVSVIHEVNYAAITGGYGRADVSRLPDGFANAICEADVIIYQPISKSHGVLSTEESVSGSVMSYASPNAIKISFPYAYNNALWPIYSERKVLNADNMLLSAARSAASEAELLAAYNSGVLRHEYFDRFEETNSILEEKEKNCDVKIARFIRKNVSKSRLFLTQNHPSSRLLIEMCRQMIDILDRRLGIGLDQDAFLQENSQVHDNACELPGYYPIDLYALRHYNFLYMSGPDANASEYYGEWLIALYNLLRGRPARAPAMPQMT